MPLLLTRYSRLAPFADVQGNRRVTVNVMRCDSPTRARAMCRLMHRKTGLWHNHRSVYTYEPDSLYRQVQRIQPHPISSESTLRRIVG